MNSNIPRIDQPVVDSSGRADRGWYNYWSKLVSSGTSSGGSTNIYNEAPSGAINSSNTIYTTSSDFATESTAVYLNGLRQQLGSDYTESASNEITFAIAPITNDILLMDYEVAA